MNSSKTLHDQRLRGAGLWHSSLGCLARLFPCDQGVRLHQGGDRDQALLLHPRHQVLHHPFDMCLVAAHTNASAIGEQHSKQLGPTPRSEVDDCDLAGAAKDCHPFLLKRPMMLMPKCDDRLLRHGDLHGVVASIAALSLISVGRHVAFLMIRGHGMT